MSVRVCMLRVCVFGGAFWTVFARNGPLTVQMMVRDENSLCRALTPTANVKSWMDLIRHLDG
jgi:hypothetical protein